MTAEELLADHLVVPVLTANDPSTAVAALAGLVEGGITIVEVALRTPQSLEVLARLIRTTTLVVGAGTVLDPNQVDAVVDAGAQFIVSPGLDDDVVERAQRRGMVVMPGVATPTEVQRARRLGLSTLKVFPAATLGGPAHISALAAPFPGMRFLPSGGISLDVAVDYLDIASVLAISGSWMLPREAVAVGDSERIRSLTEQTLKYLRGFRHHEPST